MLPSIPKELIDQFVNGPMSAEPVNSASMAFKKALIERALGAELTHHLGYAAIADKPLDAKNHRNGASAKTVLTEDGPLRIEVPRDRSGSFEPVLIPKFERRFTGFDDKIVAMYARGTPVREIQLLLLSRVKPSRIRPATSPAVGVRQTAQSHSAAWCAAGRRSGCARTCAVARRPACPLRAASSRRLCA